MKKILFTTLLISAANIIMAQSAIKGIYTLAPNPLKPVPVSGSLDRVKVVEVFSISCIHCYKFSQVEDKFTKAFGKKLDYHHMEIGWIGENLARFNVLADKFDKGNETRQLLFRSFHEAGLHDLNNPKTLQTFAKELKFPGDYDQEINKPDITASLANTASYISRFKIDSTPTFVIEDSIIVNGQDDENLAKVINSLLKSPVNYKL